MTTQPPASRDTDPDREVHYTAFIRLPFPRGDFVDPPLVDWDAAKDRALWKILSWNPRSADLEWKELASRFEVTLPFILQQAAWLYERQLSQVRAQMRKVSKDSIPSSSQGGQSMQRVGSTEKGRQGSQGNTPSLGTPRVGSTAPREHATAAWPAPPMSRNTSTNTITQSRPMQPPSPAKQHAKLAPKPVQQPPKPAAHAFSPKGKARLSDQNSLTSSEESDESSDSSSNRAKFSKSQMFRRPRFMSGRAAAKTKATVANSNNGEDEDEEVDEDNDNDDNEKDDYEDPPAFLPLAPTASNEEQQQQQDLGATLRHPQQGEAAMADSRGVTQIPSQANTDSSVSSASSAVPVPSPGDAARSQRPRGVFSTQHRAEMGAKLSPRRRGTGRDGSDGTRSMSSSFSDLDDTSVTQSALEEALISNMQHGGASRMSNVSQARSHNL